ncbi:MAG: tRNA lysidine(34) synthetase TilS [Dehalococcoidales bacterium]|nr:tRNA lysidine(34) synthetase TilS [Dehalococcoidales bacterium]
MPVKQKTIEARVRDFFKDNPFTGGRLLVAVSGGQDSVCLLRVLTDICADLEIDLQATHLNHQLRGAESDADAQYVFDLCHKLRLPVHIGQIDVKKYQQEHKLTLEEAAREVRYQFLAETAASTGTKTVVIAHTRDDQVETILLHILRGSGTRGLVGLKPVTQRRIAGKKLTIIRPLLGVTHEETGVYCRAHKLQPRFDTSNLSVEPLRNRVRLELLPALQTYNRNVAEALLRASRIAADDVTYLEDAARKKWRQIAALKQNQIIFDRAKITALPVSMQRALLRMAVEKLTGTLKDIEARHIEDMLEFLRKPAGKRMDLPYGMTFAADYAQFVLGLTPEKEKATGLAGEDTVKLNGRTVIPGWEISASYVPRQKDYVSDVYTAYLDADKVGEKLLVRPRQSGDRFQPLGMKAMKKVSEFLLDARVPRGQRARIPILVSEKQVVWVVGQRIDDRVKVTSETGRVLKIVFERKI